MVDHSDDIRFVEGLDKANIRYDKMVVVEVEG